VRRIREKIWNLRSMLSRRRMRSCAARHPERSRRIPLKLP
jgi:hypothetical protein